MLQGKIFHTGTEYLVKVGTVTVDITADVHALIGQEVAKFEQALAELRAKNTDTLDRYNQIARIVLAGGAGMPTG
jgi:hypothetical protein